MHEMGVPKNMQPVWYLKESIASFFHLITPSKFNIDTQNEVFFLMYLSPFKYGNLGTVSILNFRGVFLGNFSSAFIRSEDGLDAYQELAEHLPQVWHQDILKYLVKSSSISKHVHQFFLNVHQFIQNLLYIHICILISYSYIYNIQI